MRPRINSQSKLDKNNNVLSSLFLEYQNKENKELNENNQNEIVQRTKSVFIDINKLYKKNIFNNIKIDNNDDFNKIIEAKLDEIKNKSRSKLDNLINQYNTNYDKYKTKILNYLNTKDNNISKVNINSPKNNSLLKFAVQNIFKKIEYLTEIYDKIINNIEDNFELLNNFLEKNDLINNENPLESFLIKNSDKIFNCSFLTKFDFEEINPSNICKINYYKNYLEFLNSYKKKIRFNCYKIGKQNLNGGIEFIKENFGSFKKLNIINIDENNLKKIYNSICSSNYKENILDTVEIKEFDFSNNINIVGTVENDSLNRIKHIKLKKGIINPESKILSELFLLNNKRLNSLCLEKVDMSNNGYKFLMEQLYKNQNILNNLEYLSLSGNAITYIDANGKKDKIFKSLKIFDLSKNDIYSFEMDLTKLPVLKLLDLSSNSIPISTKMDNIIEKEKDKLVLFNNNIFITNCSSNNNIYIKYLNEQLSKLDFDLKKLNLCFTYDMDNQNELEKLLISPAIKISLINLDLSYCGLSTNVLINFLKNNFGLFSLKKLKLDYNNILSDIFEKIISDEILLENLNVLDLSENEIQCKKYEENEFLKSFIQKYQNLEVIKLKNSLFYRMWNINLDIKNIRELYNEIIDYIETNNRKFHFIVEKKSEFLEKKYENLFIFKED